MCVHLTRAISADICILTCTKLSLFHTAAADPQTHLCQAHLVNTWSHISRYNDTIKTTCAAADPCGAECASYGSASALISYAYIKLGAGKQRLQKVCYTECQLYESAGSLI